MLFPVPDGPEITRGRRKSGRGDIERFGLRKAAIIYALLYQLERRRFEQCIQCRSFDSLLPINDLAQKA